MINLAAVAVSLGALQSSSMPIKELNNPMTPLGERDLPPNPACHLTSVSRNAPGEKQLVYLRLKEPGMEGETPGVDRGAFSNDLGLRIFQNKVSLVPPGSWKSQPREGQPWKTKLPVLGWGRGGVGNVGGPVAAV